MVLEACTQRSMPLYSSAERKAMPTYLVVCELHRAGGPSSYPELLAQLDELGAVQIAESSWLVRPPLEDMMGVWIGRQLDPFLDMKDTTFITHVSEWSCSKNLRNL